MERIDSYGKQLWETGERDYQRAARRFIHDALESEDAFTYLRHPIAEAMGAVFARLRRAHLESLPVPRTPPLAPAASGTGTAPPPVVAPASTAPSPMPPAPGCVAGRETPPAAAVPRVPAPRQEPVPLTPAAQRLAHLDEEVYIRGREVRGYVPWAEVTLEDALATIVWSESVVQGIRHNRQELDRAVTEMRRHVVEKVADLPLAALMRIFGELAA